MFAVRLRAASGRILDLHIPADSERRASTLALNVANSDHPGQGWLVQWVLG